MARADLKNTGMDAREVVRKLRKLRRKDMPRAMRDALNATGKAAGKSGLKAVSDEYKLPQKAFRKSKSRRRVHETRATARKLRYKIWLGSRPVSAMSAGKPRQLKKKGVRAGKHVFPGAFVHKTGSYAGVVFRRKGHARNAPLEVPRISIKGAPKLFDREVHKAIPREFPKRFIRQIKRYQRLR